MHVGKIELIKRQIPGDILLEHCIITVDGNASDHIDQVSSQASDNFV